MLKKIIRAIKAIAKQLAIAFFFASIIIFIIGTSIKDRVDLLFSVMNKMAVTEKTGEREQISFDALGKHLANYPSYGTEWATLKIPSIELTKTVIHGDDLDILKYNIGHYAGSYFPGEGGTIIICGHNMSKFFYNLPKVKIDDEITIEADYGVFTYRVYDTKIIKETDKDSLPINKDEEILMIYTCYPVGSIGHKDQRFVVYAKLESFKYAGETDES